MLRIGKLNKKAEGKPIARVVGGKHDGSVIYLIADDIDALPVEREEKLDFIADEVEDKEIRSLAESFLGCKLSKLYSSRASANLIELIKQNLIDDNKTLVTKLPVDASIKELYDYLYEYFNNQCAKSIFISDGIIQQICEPKVSLRQYVAGPSESGKSYYASNLIREYRKVNPSNKIYLFSDVLVDDQLDKLGVIRVKLDQSLVDEPIESKELKDSLCIFDDVDSITDKNIKKSVAVLRDAMLTRGRHDNISTLSTLHTLTNSKETKIILNESNFITLFPKASSKMSITYILQQYCGMDQDEIRDVLKIKTRWITYSKQYPRYVMHQNGIKLL
jgi:hypothetical protein